ncbi:hypothetical protein AAG906_013074 [Vitis piasezkii]
MSRCFPFPPPGYEKKARTDDADLLKKEKHREKKHKKEKREKEKKEGKEKREKDRGDGRHKEKKDRKDKHRDRKKDKEKDREKKRQNITSDEKRLASEFEGFNAEKLSQKEVRDRDKNSVSNEKRFAGQLVGYNEEKLTQSSHLGEGNKDSKFLQELGRRIRAEDGGNGNQLVEKFTGTDRRKDEAMARLVAKDVSVRTEGRKRTRTREVRIERLMGKESGMSQELVEIQWLRVLLELVFIGLKELRNHWRRRLRGGWKQKKRPKTRKVMINEEINVRIEIERKKVKGRRKIGIRRRERRRKKRRKLNTRTKNWINQKKATKMMLQLPTISKHHIFTRTATRVLLPREITGNGRTLTQMDFCMSMKLSLISCQDPLLIH